jgi:hypothetical protein
MSLIVIKISDIEHAINKSINILINTFKIVSSNNVGEEIGGWHQFIFDNKMGAVATSQSIACFAYSNKKFGKLPLAINLLKNEQFKNGGFTIKILSEFPIVESTSWVLLGIRDLRNEIAMEIITEGAKWLENNRNEDNGWGVIKGTASRIYTTSLAIWALSVTKGKDYQAIINEGIDWIKNTRNADGCWGELPRDERSTPFHTAFVIFMLRQCGIPADSDIISTSLRWLDEQWDKECMWDSHEETANLLEHYDLETAPTKWTRIVWNRFATPWVIIALLNCGIINGKVFRGIDWLIKSQTKEGGWKHRNVNELTLWATHDALFCLTSFLEHVVNIKNYDSVELHDNVLVLKGKFNLARKVKTAISLSAIFIKKYWAGVIISLYLLIGGICALENLWTLEYYVIGLVIPISLLVIQWGIGKTVVIIK